MSKQLSRKEKEDLARSIMSRQEKEALARSLMEKQQPEVVEEVVIAQPEPTIKDTLQDVAVSAVEGPTMGFSDELYGAASAGMQKAMGAEEPIEDIYVLERNKVRNLQNIARERSPYLSAASELGAGMLTGAAALKGASKVPTALRALFAPKNIPQAMMSGGAQMAGATETSPTEQPMEFAAQVSLGSTIGGGSKYVGDVVSSAFKDPAAIKASALGATKKSFKVKGPQNRKKMVETLSQTGFYDQKPMVYSTVLGKFVPAKGKDAAALVGDSLPETYLARAEDAIDKLFEANQQILSEKTVSAKKVMSALEDTIKNAELGSDLPESSIKKANNFVSQWASENLKRFEGMDKIPAVELESLKRELMSSVSGLYSKVGQADVNIAEMNEVRMALASRLKNVLESEVGVDVYARNNKLMSALYTQKSDLDNLLAAEAAKSGTGKLDFSTIAKTITSPLSSTDATMSRAAIGDKLNQFANMSKALGLTAQQLPQKGLASMMGGEPNMSMETGANMSRQPQAGGGYNFQNVKPFIEAPLNPDTESILNNQGFFLHKIAIMKGKLEAEDMEATIKRFRNDLPRLRTLLAKYAYKNPEMFAFDEYNRFDGIIQEDVDIQKAMQDLKKSKMGARERARLTDSLKNKKEVPSWHK